MVKIWYLKYQRVPLLLPKDKEKAEKLGYKGNYTRLGNACWFTNIDHGRRHQPLSLMTMADNLKYSKHKQIREQGYLKYDNYDAIEVPFDRCYPSDYVEDMGDPNNLSSTAQSRTI